ncbi:MAG TPA: 3-carboxy-cis,cis-muconate cycloisomerase [Gemmatimonadaceae bacterium]|jgi:3-carboxy-cis,cis-muconate cycloisomerase|nr:3-carboxy-cis,cis-muconate cycloisomerase [Gemmatimonadaceae bacterium]
MILDALFGDPDVDVVLSDASRVAAMLRVEVALARAQAATGVIPERAVDAIARSADVDDYDFDALARDSINAGNLAIPLVRHLTERVARADADAARYVHWGATSQDIIDTATVQQLRAATEIVLRSLTRAGNAAESLVRRHGATVMPGRTWLQHATPITFALKAAGWMSALDRVHEALANALAGAAVLQFGGASGTLASLGDRGPDVAAALGAALKLDVPELPWHAHRDRLATLACALGVAIGTMGKVARDIALLAQTEVAEAFESAAGGRGGSSTMPQKRNPVGASVVLAASVRAPGLVATMLAAMPQEHERGLGGWQAEWETLPELVHLAGGAAKHVADMLTSLEVDAKTMRANVDITNGTSLAESISMALAEHVGKSEAHTLVEAASRSALAEHRALADVLASMPDVTKHLGKEEIARRLRPDEYLGASEAMVRAALEHRAHERSDATRGKT